MRNRAEIGAIKWRVIMSGPKDLAPREPSRSANDILTVSTHVMPRRADAAWDS